MIGNDISNKQAPILLIDANSVIFKPAERGLLDKIEVLFKSKERLFLERDINSTNRSWVNRIWNKHNLAIYFWVPEYVDERLVFEILSRNLIYFTNVIKLTKEQVRDGISRGEYIKFVTEDNELENFVGNHATCVNECTL